MASEEDQLSKSEEPTEKKLRESRKKGDVPSSKEPANLMGVLSLFLIAAFLSPTLFPRLGYDLGEVISNAAFVEIGTGRTGMSDIGVAVGNLKSGIASFMGPVMMVLVLAALFGVFVQGELVFALERLKPKASKISPLAGFKRLFSADAFVEFGKNMAKVLIVAGLSIWIGHRAVVGIWQSADAFPETLMSYGLGAALKILVATTALLFFTSSVDVIWKRSQWYKKQRMTKREVTDEHKDTEGDPHIKAKRAAIRRQRSKQRIATAVPTATVVLTNPTHYAVALRFEMGRDNGPVCVAKGTDLIAAQIRKIAREAEVPILENRPLARALHASVEVDETVPTEHWRAVAEIIGYVLSVRRSLSVSPPTGTRVRTED